MSSVGRWRRTAAPAEPSWPWRARAFGFWRTASSPAHGSFVRLIPLSVSLGLGPVGARATARSGRHRTGKRYRVAAFRGCGTLEGAFGSTFSHPRPSAMKTRDDPCRLNRWIVEGNLLSSTVTVGFLREMLPRCRGAPPSLAGRIRLDPERFPYLAHRPTYPDFD